MTFATYLRCSIISMQWNCCLHCSVLIIYLYIPLVSVFWRPFFFFVSADDGNVYSALVRPYDPSRLCHVWHLSLLRQG